MKNDFEQPKNTRDTFPPEMREKAKKLFGETSEVTSVLSDLCVASGITAYQESMPNMTQQDAERLTELVKIYNNIDFAADFKTGGQKQKETCVTIDSLLKQIIARK